MVESNGLELEMALTAVVGLKPTAAVEVLMAAVA